MLLDQVTRNHRSSFQVVLACGLALVVLTLSPTVSDAQVGINNPSPDQVLDVNGKIRVGDDVIAPTPGTLRYNTSASDFEGWNGTAWVSLTRPTLQVQSVLQNGSQITNIRDSDVYFADSITIAESGEYLIFYSGELIALSGGTTTLSADRSWQMDLTLTRGAFEFAFSSVFRPALIEVLPAGATAYQFRNNELGQKRVTQSLVAGDVLQVRYHISSNPGQAVPTSNYFMTGTRIDAIRIGP